MRPTDVTELDWLKFELASVRKELADARLENVRLSMVNTYQLAPGDAIDPQTRAIKRAAQPTPNM
jgi:hypothetical protein